MTTGRSAAASQWRVTTGRSAHSEPVARDDGPLGQQSGVRTGMMRGEEASRHRAAITCRLSSHPAHRAADVAVFVVRRTGGGDLRTDNTAQTVGKL